jgi:acyl carrier protein
MKSKATHPQFTQEQVQSIICTHLGFLPEEITPETSFKQLGASQIDLLEIGNVLIKELNITIDDSKFTSLDSLKDAYSYIATCQNSKG